MYFLIVMCMKHTLQFLIMFLKALHSKKYQTEAVFFPNKYHHSCTIESKYVHLDITTRATFYILDSLFCTLQHIGRTKVKRSNPS